MSTDYDYLLKVIFIGDSGTGKSSFIQQLLNGRLTNHPTPTIGIIYHTITIQNNENKIIKVQIWDTAGQEVYRSIGSAYYRGVHGAILLYDITDRRTFESLPSWIEEFRSNFDQTKNSKEIIMIIGNKCDLEDQRQVSIAEALEFAQANELVLIETSALKGTRIHDAFNKIVDEMYTVRKTLTPSEGTVLPEGSISLKVYSSESQSTSCCNY